MVNKAIVTPITNWSNLLLTVTIACTVDSLVVREGKGSFDKIPSPNEEHELQSLYEKVAEFIESRVVEPVNRLGELKSTSIVEHKHRIVKELKGVLIMLITRKDLQVDVKEGSVLRKGNLIVSFLLSEKQ